MYLIQRDTLPAVTEVAIDGRVHKLGLVKDLRGHPEFARIVPPDTNLSISWVRLQQGERLEEHRHPTTSLIIVTEGAGEVTGDLCQPLRAGDSVLVPPDCLHGFIGAPPHGFCALSVQFEGRALYADLERPRVVFDRDQRAATQSKLEVLIREHQSYLREYSANPLVSLVKDPRAHEPQVKERLLAGLHAWSNIFQRVLCARAALQTDPRFRALAEHHMAEELGHNLSLARLRAQGQDIPWDAGLVAAGSWFIERALGGSPVEQVILIHFVLEGSGAVFHCEALRLFPDAEHFTSHAAVDADHFELGLAALREQRDLDLQAARKVLREGWSMMQFLSGRIAAIALGEA